MAAPHLAWSHSRLNTYKTCPGQLYHTAIAPRGHPDRVEYIQSEAARAGSEVDDALTKRISLGTPLPPKYAKYEDMAQMFLKQPGAKLTQLQLALDRSFQPCGSKDWDRVWVRAIYDIAVINGNYMFVGDWKNGQMLIDEQQLRLFATVGFHHYQEVDYIDTSYIWLAHNQLSPKSYRRSELADLWQTFLPDVERMQVSWKNNDWPKTPSPRACKWCSVNEAGKCPVAAVKFGKAK